MPVKWSEVDGEHPDQEKGFATDACEGTKDVAHSSTFRLGVMTQSGLIVDDIFNYVDLFAGCGGLSLGLRSAGGRHVLAVEKSPMAAETYFKNLISRDDLKWLDLMSSGVTEQAQKGLVVGPLSSILTDARTMSSCKSKSIDVVAGGPPCQGFSMAGRRQKDDPRNALALEFLKFVDSTDPKFVIIENVLGMHRKFSRESDSTPFEEIRSALARQGSRGGYRVQGVLLNAKHYGAPQSRPRMMLVGIREDIGKRLRIVVSDTVQRSGYQDDPQLDCHALLPPPDRDSQFERKVCDALHDLSAKGLPNLSAHPDGAYLSELNDAGRWMILERLGKELPNTALRRHRPETQELFAVLGALKRLGVLAAARRARASEFVGNANVEFEALVNDQTEKFPVGSSMEGLLFDTPAELIRCTKKRLTLKHSQTLLDWDRPSRTIVTIPDDYIHPKYLRTFSVRELARLQGFPDSFEFHGKITTGGFSRRTEVPQYTQVGNAVSPFVGLALGKMIAELIARLHRLERS